MGQDSREWALISSWGVRVPGAEVRAGDHAGTLGGARPIYCPSPPGVAGPWAPWASSL